MASVSLTVNGANHTVDVEPATPLLYVLRNDLNLQGPRFGCGLGQCGACAVIINGVATRGVLHPVQQAWIDEQVPQCGFCQNGQIIAATAMLARTPTPTDAQIRET